jgi:uncharacterized protein
MLPAMTRSRGAGILTLFLASTAASAAVAQGGDGKPKRLLFFTKSSGYEHAVIKVKDGQPSLAQKTLEDLAARHGFQVTHTKDGGVFTPQGIAAYDAFIFFTSGDLGTPGNDKNPPMPPEGKTTLLKAIAGGKGFVGIHQATGTFQSAGDRYQANGEATDPFIKMVGGEFIFHGQQQTARVLCSGGRFPGLSDCRDHKDDFDLMEEWYSFKNLAPDLHVLQSVATWSLKNTGKDSVYRRPPYPITWARKEGKGRVFVTGMGHRDDVWASARFQNLLVGGIKWATGLASATVKPNIATVTPGFAILPPNDAPAAAPGATATATPSPSSSPSSAPAAPAAPAAPLTK